jgi:hypothetical protein
MCANGEQNVVFDLNTWSLPGNYACKCKLFQQSGVTTMLRATDFLLLGSDCHTYLSIFQGNPFKSGKGHAGHRKWLSRDKWDPTNHGTSKELLSQESSQASFFF